MAGDFAVMFVMVGDCESSFESSIAASINSSFCVCVYLSNSSVKMREYPGRPQQKWCKNCFSCLLDG